MKRCFLFPIFVLMPLTACSMNNINHVRAITRSENQVVKIGDVITVEPRVLQHESESKVVQGQIILPDGTSQAGKSFAVTMPGVYRVEYRAFFGIEEVSESIYYHCYRESGDLFISSNPNNKAVNGEFSYSDKSNKIKGAKLKLDASTKYTFDGVIDFNTFNANESFFRFIVDPSKQGESDIESFNVRLTDVNDDTNYVDILVSDSGLENDEGQGCYVLAGANNQAKTGYELYRPERSSDPDYMPHINVWGSNVASSFRALNSDYNPDRTAEFYFNYAEKQLYAYPMYNEWTKNMITDLDDPKVYGSMIWEGFSNGKAKITISASSLKSASANIIVTKIANFDLSKQVFEDHDGPVINIDYENQSPSNLPKATINKPYKIFKASAEDTFDHEVPYDVSVTYVDEVHDKVKDISVVNNAFTPKEVGKYVISYHSRDYSLNETIETVEVYAVNDAQKMTITFDQPIISQNIYTDFVLPSVDDIHITGGSGKATVTRRIEDSNHQEIEITGDTFAPTEVGTYYAYYSAFDYIGNTAEGVLELRALDPELPIFIGDVVLPRVVIKGHTYTLPSFESAEVVNGQTVSLNSKIYINNTLIEGNTFVADGTGGVCKVLYRVDGETGTATRSYDISLVDSGDPINQSRYFTGDFGVTEQQNYVGLSATTDAHSLFASVLAYDNPYVKFALNNKNFGDLVFKYSDSKNPSLSVSFHITFNNNKTYLSVGDSEDKYEFASEDDTLGDTYEISFDNSSRVITDIAQTELTKVKYFDNGETFTGFKNGLYLDIYLNGVNASSSFKMLKIGNQNLGYRSDHKDHGAPIVLLSGDFYSEIDYGDLAIIPAAEAFDVLSDTTITVSVRSPKFAYIIRDQDARVPHTFELTEFGSYIVTYRATDASGNNSVPFSRTIRVYDTTPPEIIINGSLKDSYNLNASISIPKYTVTDNLNDYVLDIFLILPNDEERLLIIDENGEVTSYLDKHDPTYNDSFKVNSTTFKAEQRGRYVLRYVAYDSDFNKSVVEFTFVVK